MRILLAEDEKDLSKILSTALTHEGHEVSAAYHGKEALEFARQQNYDCMIFDIMMPVMDGLEALKILRESGNQTPVILLTAKSQVEDRITGLDLGADDYLSKPFFFFLLFARIRSITRRHYIPNPLSFGSVSLDTSISEMSSENAVRLSPKELKLMQYLMLHPKEKISTNELMIKIWPENQNEDVDMVWMYVSYLRAKLRSILADIEIVGEKGESFALVQSGG